MSLAVNEIIQGQIINMGGKCLRGSDDQKPGKISDLHSECLGDRK
jgi:hypothetical protein